MIRSGRGLRPYPAPRPRHATPHHVTPRHVTPHHVTPRHVTRRISDCVLMLIGTVAGEA